MINSVKGTHDVILDEALQYDSVERFLQSCAEIYGFKEFRTPVLEHTELFMRSVGQSSDIVRKEMYTFLDKGDRSLTLRPEVTAGAVRAIVNNKLLALDEGPVKAYYCGPAFRYERPQAGRYRQFQTFGVEIVGINNPYRDIEVIAFGYDCLKTLGFDNLILKINSLGDKESRTKYNEALREYFSKHVDHMCHDCQERYNLNVLRILDCKREEDQEIIKNAPKINDFLSEKSKDNLSLILKELDKMNISYQYDPTLVRGLDYYSEIVFEFHFIGKSGVNYGAICGGGHYSSLVEEVGGPKGTEGCGLGFGIERIMSLLKEEDSFFSNLSYEIDIFLMALDEKFNSDLSLITAKLRKAGFTAEAIFEKKSMKSFLKKADKNNALYVCVIKNEKEAFIKDLKKQEQFDIETENVYQELHKLMTGHIGNKPF